MKKSLTLPGEFRPDANRSNTGQSIGASGQMEIRPQKRVFIGLLVFTCLVLSLLIFFLWYVPTVML